MTRINWHEYFLAQAKLASLRATCTRLKVGAVIVRENRIVASGYNGSVSDSAHCIDEGCKLVKGHCVRTVHAEANAILQCAKFGVATADTTLYVTHFPCLQCTKLLLQAGISKVYYESDYRNDEIAKELLEEAGIVVEKVSLDYLLIDEDYKRKDALIKELTNYLTMHSTDTEYIEKIKGAIEILKEVE